MLRVSFVFTLFVSIQCRVNFRYSQFIDGSDLKISNQTDFECSKGCMVYSATENSNLIIVNKGTGKEVTNLNTLANSNNNDRSYLYGITLPAATYTLKEKNGNYGSIFGLYVVSNEAPNYGQSLRVADAFSTPTFSSTSGMITIMTRGTGIRMMSPTSDSAMTPRVFSTGYDAPSPDDCWPVYIANSLYHAQQSQIDVIGPIATIRFDGLPSMTEARVKVSGDVLSEAADQLNSLTISSPGFNGCKFTDNNVHLYQYDMNKMNRRFKSDLEQNVNVHIRSKQWIPNESDALFIYGLQDQPVKLMGEQSYEHDYLVNKVDLQLNWQRDYQNSNFAVQMDATKVAATSSLFLLLISTILSIL